MFDLISISIYPCNSQKLLSLDYERRVNTLPLLFWKLRKSQTRLMMKGYAWTLGTNMSTVQGVKLRLIQEPMRLKFSLWRPNPVNQLPNWRLEFLITPYLEIQWLLKICKDKPAAKFLVEPISKMQHMHDFEHKSRRHLGFR